MESCRKRQTPPYARFLGRKACVCVVVVLVAAMISGPSTGPARHLHAALGTELGTPNRWRQAWLE